MNEYNTYIGLNVYLLKQGIEVLGNLDNEVFNRVDPPRYKSNIGTHFRHILDHYISLLEGWNNKIDYDARIRGTGIETDADMAKHKCTEVIENLTKIASSELNISREVLVKSNIEGSKNESPWSVSSIKRELQFLVSHTVHHYALVKLILTLNGRTAPEHFGIAPSTLKFMGKELGNER